MSFIKFIKEDLIQLSILVKPNSRIRGVSKVDLCENFITFYVKSPPKNNKANKELIKLLQSTFQSLSHVKIIAGMKNQHKVVELSFKNKINKDALIKDLKKT
jgi:uncharacterized protein (TIGR00251 family)